MGKIGDALERLWYGGYTAAEYADLQRRYIAKVAEQAIADSLDRLIAEDEAGEGEDEQEGEADA